MANYPQPQGQQRYRGGSPSMRGDGSSVPGNQPGGENGSYGKFGQAPDLQPPSTPPAGEQSFGGKIKQGIAQRFGSSPGGQMINSLAQRYRGGQQPQDQQNSFTPQAFGSTAPNDPGSAYMGPGGGQSDSQGLQDSPDSSSMLGASPSMSGAPVMGQDQTDSGGGAASPQPAPAQTPTAPTVMPATDGAAPPQMAHGGIVSKPTMAMLGEHGPEAVVPLNNPAAKVTPGMFGGGVPYRNRRMTGTSGLHGPLHPLEPTKGKF